MPELPEVETIRLGLEKYLVGHTIVSVDVGLRKIVTGDTKQIFGSKVKAVRRAGKGLIIDLDNDYSMAVHIKLTGQLIYRGSRVPRVSRVSLKKIGRDLPNKWTYVIFKLDRDSLLYYNDVRQFGWIKILPTSEVDKLPFFRELGPEPPVVPLRGTMKGQAPLTLEKFKEIVGRSSTKIKPFLMDQKKIGGVGNIYANEALFFAGIDPRRTAKQLSNEEMKKLYDAIIQVLKKGLKYHGATELNFVDALGQEGEYQQHFLVYSQEGEPCPKKNGIIKKIKLGGRGTYFCEKCQK